ncbi:MAG: HD domain-containing phosphohydrolase [Bacteriovoracia bacterium]
MKILLVNDKDVVGDIIGLAIENYFDGSVVELTTSPAEAIARLGQDAGFSFVISSYSFQDGTNAEILLEHLAGRNGPPLVLITGEKLTFKTPGPAALVPEPLEIKVLVEKIEALIPREKQGGREQRYCRVATKTLLLSSEKYEVDLFIKLSEEKYVKAINVGDFFSPADYEKFSAKKVTFLYVRREDFLSLVDRWMKDLQKMSAAKPGEISLADALNVFSSIHSTVHAALGDEGFSPEIKKLTEASVNLAIRTIQDNPKLSELFDKLKENIVPYISAHSTALTFLSCRLASLIDWNSDTTFYKLSLAAYLHDITIEQDDWAKYSTRLEILQSSLTESEVRKLFQHPATAAALVSEIEGIPGEVGFIIEQHHEATEGEGFPNGITHKDISPISALFIIAHDAVSEMHRNPEAFDFKDFLRAREKSKTYVRGSLGVVFRSILEKTADKE